MTTAHPPTVLDLFHDAVTRAPAAVALDGSGAPIDRAGLRHEVDLLASRLVHAGVQHGGPVAVLLPHSPDVVVAVWGVLHAGAPYLPLDPQYPDQRLELMIEDSGARTIVTTTELHARAVQLAPDATVLVVDGHGADVGDAPAPPVVDPDAAAYVIYTSGSSGRPKGVQISHRALHHQMRWLLDAGHLSDSAAVLLKTPLSFDAAQWEILAVCGGARLVVGSDGVFRDPTRLLEEAQRHGVTTLQAVPTLLRALVESEDLAKVETLRSIMSGGERLSATLVRQILDALPNAEVTNLYGPTEFTINAVTHSVDRSSVGAVRTSDVPIGTVVPGCRARVVDRSLRDVSPGESGELLLAGPQLADGYLGRPDLTAERFVRRGRGPDQERYYRTGDIVRLEDGLLYFEGRADNQVKLRGHRIELDEVDHRVAEHPWVRAAVTVVSTDPRTSRDQLVTWVELDSTTAPVMDEDLDSAHHRSKSSRLQVRAQLSNAGVRTDPELDAASEVVLGEHGKDHVRRAAFARKTYRNFHGAPSGSDVLAALAPANRAGPDRASVQLDADELTRLLRWFHQFPSSERVLPKTSYASPGALFATQLMLSCRGVPAVGDGTYYYHPVRHRLYRVGPAGRQPGPSVRVAFVGRPSAIQAVYTNNVREVLELEAGHMLGALEEAAREVGLHVVPVAPSEETEPLALADGDQLLARFALSALPDDSLDDLVETYLQSHGRGIDGLAPGLHRLQAGRFTCVSRGTVGRTDLIAINQGVYDRSSLGVALVSTRPGDPLEYVALGRSLHRLQRNDHSIGLMSAGYSSRTGRPSPAARRLTTLLDLPAGTASYFAVGGSVTEEQVRSEGMGEDAVHMRGPAEIIAADLRLALPQYMVPARTLVLDSLPLLPNGKIDVASLRARAAEHDVRRDRRATLPATPTEQRLSRLWAEQLHYEDVSVDDDFFAVGGDSLIAVSMAARIQKELRADFKVQSIFANPTLRELAAQVDGAHGPATRLLDLSPRRDGTRPTVFCWPGLGGSPLNLRALGEACRDRDLVGVQTWGINEGEEPFSRVDAMARADIVQILQTQRQGPYTLWGYSFGARVAFEVAWQLEQSGHEVASLVLICPGNPIVDGESPVARRAAGYADPTYLRILYSVFAGTSVGHEAERCLREAVDEDTFVEFITAAYPQLAPASVRRIIHVVETTFQFEYSFDELTGRRLSAPVTIVRATGDDYSFLDTAHDFSLRPPHDTTLRGDHYSLLREDVGELVRTIETAGGSASHRPTLDRSTSIVDDSRRLVETVR